MSQKVRILSVKVDGAPFIGLVTPTSPDGARLHGPGTPTWSSDPDQVMTWLCDAYRTRFNTYRANRKKYVWEDDPDQTGRRRKALDSDGNPVLTPIGSFPEEDTRTTTARKKHPHLAAVPDLVLQVERAENKDWFAAVKRRKTLTAKGRKAGRMPGLRRKDSDARFVCLHNSGRAAILTRTGRRSGIITITGQNPARWRGPAGSKFTITIRVRLSQEIRPYTSVQVNWTRRELVFVNEPAALARKQATGAAVGLDLGVAQTIATSDGAFHAQPGTADLDAKIRHHSKAMARSARINNPTGAKNWTPTKGYLRHRQARADAYAAKTRRLEDWRQKTTTALVLGHDVIAVEDLDVKNMTRSARGTLEAPGKNVAAKQGLNRSLAQAAFGTLRGMLAYKTDALIRAGHDQHLLAVNPKNTSRRCRECGHTAKENRKSQAVFSCQSCTRTGNADTNAAGNVLDDALKNWGWTTQEHHLPVTTVTAPAGSKRKTDPSEEDLAPGPDGSCDEPRTTQHAPAA